MTFNIFSVFDKNAKRKELWTDAYSTAQWHSKDRPEIDPIATADAALAAYDAKFPRT